jgi:hypothetical protein
MRISNFLNQNDSVSFIGYLKVLSLLRLYGIGAESLVIKTSDSKEMTEPADSMNYYYNM